VKNLVIARRYAKALLLIGKENDQAEAYREELDSISELMSKEKDLEQAKSNKPVSTHNTVNSNFFREIPETFI